MKKILLFVFSLSLFASFADAQTTNVTLQVTDLGSQTWNNGTWSVVLVSPPGASTYGPPFYNAGTATQVPNQTQSGTLGTTGASGTIVLTQNAGISPFGTQWKFVVCPQWGTLCFTQLVTITASTSVTIAPPAIVVSCAFGVSAYADAEVNCGVGGQYYNVTSSASRVCTAASSNTCTTWTAGGGITSVAVLPATCTPGSVYQLNVAPFTAYTCPATGVFSDFTGTNAIKATDFGVKGDGINLTDLSWSNSSNVVTSAGQANFQCPGAVYPCTSGGDTGKFFAGTDTCLVGSVATSVDRFANNTTITQVTSSTVIVVSNNSTAAIASGGCGVYGTNQDTALAALDTAYQAAKTCPMLVFPSGIISMQNAHFITQPAACARLGPVSGSNVWGLGAHLIGQGKGATIFYPMPGFNTASCTGALGGCFGGTSNMLLEHMSFSGFGNVAISLAPWAGKCWIGSGPLGGLWINDVAFYTFASGSGSSPTAICDSFGTLLTGVTNETFGATQVSSNGGAVVVQNYNGSDNNGSGNWFTFTNAILNSQGEFLLGPTVLAASAGQVMLNMASGSKFFSHPTDRFLYTAPGSANSAILFVDATSTAYINGGQFSDTVANGEGWSISGKAYITQPAIVVGNGTFPAITVPSGGTVIDYEGATITNGLTGVGTWTGPNTLQGSCSGVVTSATTVGLYPLGQRTTLTCTTAVVNLGQVMEKAGTIIGLLATATAGNQAADVITVVKNGVAQTMTCSLNGVASCQDYASGHYVTYVVGDVISLEAIGGTGTTLASVKGTLVRTP